MMEVASVLQAAAAKASRLVRTAGLIAYPDGIWSAHGWLGVWNVMESDAATRPVFFDAGPFKHDVWFSDV